MKISGTVHSCSQQPVQVWYKMGENEVLGTVPGLVVEVTSPTRSWTFDYIPTDAADLAAQLTRLAPGTTISWEI